MKIKLDDTHYLNSDSGNYWITTVIKTEKGKTKEYEKRVSGYEYTLEAAFESFADKYVGGVDVDSFNKLLTAHRKLKKQIKEWCQKLGDLND